MHFYYDLSQKVESTSIDEVFYNSDTYEMAIKFKNGNTAGYRAVAKAAYEKFVSADSVGQYYNWYIKGYFTGFKVDGITALAPKEEKKQAVFATPEEGAGKFRVVAEITGPATLDVYAIDIMDAMKQAEEQINKAFNGDVKIVFKGVNLV